MPSTVALQALTKARAVCADIDARPLAYAAATGEPTEWDDRTTLVDVAFDYVDWPACRNADAVYPDLLVLIYGTPTPYGTAAVRRAPMPEAV